MKRSGMVALLVLFLFVVACDSVDAPKIYTGHCQKCHGLPGDVSKNVAPDLAKSDYDFEQFKQQITFGSKWKGKPAVKYAFRHRTMPPQGHISEEQMVEIFDFVQRSR